MTENNHIQKGQKPQYVQPLHPPTWMGDTQPTPALSPDDVETGEIPGKLGEPTIAMDRVPTGATPTAELPRTVPPPQRPGYVPPLSLIHISEPTRPY